MCLLVIKKNILYDCVNFVAEDDSVKTEGFLAPDIIVTGEFQIWIASRI